MPAGGRLTIAAATESQDHELEIRRLRAGRYVRVTVADTGSGMDLATLGRAAEPFFTTKPKGKGTGLGLSMAKGFTEQSGGAFDILSELGRGTTVTLWLPQVDIATTTTPPPLAPLGAELRPHLRSFRGHRATPRRFWAQRRRRAGIRAPGLGQAARATWAASSE